MTLSDKAAILGALSAECPRCHTVDRLGNFATHFGDRSGLTLVACLCGCGCRWRRVEVK